MVTMCYNKSVIKEVLKMKDYYFVQIYYSFDGEIVKPVFDGLGGYFADFDCACDFAVECAQLVGFAFAEVKDKYGCLIQSLHCFPAHNVTCETKGEL